MEKEKLCPLNNMEPCIKEKCAWYFPYSAIAEQGLLKASTDFKSSLDVMCAVNIGVASTLQLLVSDQLNAALLAQGQDKSSETA